MHACVSYTPGVVGRALLHVLCGGMCSAVVRSLASPWLLRGESGKSHTFCLFFTAMLISGTRRLYFRAQVRVGRATLQSVVRNRYGRGRVLRVCGREEKHDETHFRSVAKNFAARSRGRGASIFPVVCVGTCGCAMRAHCLHRERGLL
jgi:hypothetical protein